LRTFPFARGSSNQLSPDEKLWKQKIQYMMFQERVIPSLTEADWNLYATRYVLAHFKIRVEEGKQEDPPDIVLSLRKRGESRARKQKKKRVTG
jgi:hypothetical protein